MPVSELKEHPFCRGLKDEYVDLIAKLASLDVFKQGEFIFRTGEVAETFFLIRSGKVDIEVASPHNAAFTLQDLGAGEVLGWSWLIPPHQWRFSAQAKDRVDAIAVDGKALREACEQNHDLGYEIFKRIATVMTSRLASTRTKLLNVYNHF